MMNSLNPMDQRLDEVQVAERRFDARRDALNLADPANATAYLNAFQEMQLSLRAADLTLRSRHGLLKKVMAELK